MMANDGWPVDNKRVWMAATYWCTMSNYLECREFINLSGKHCSSRTSYTRN